MKHLGLLLLGSLLTAAVAAEEIGSVSTKFKWFGPNDKVVIEVFEDP